MATEPTEATSNISPPLWQRGMAVLTPFCGGILFIGGIEDLNNDQTLVGLVKIALAASLLISAWRGTM